MQLDLKKIPFSRRLSRHMIYEETDNSGAGWAKGLYLALASESGGSFIGGPAGGPKGFIRVIPTFGGRAREYSYTAFPFLLEMQAEGGRARFALDGAKVLRIEGEGIGIRLDGKLGFGENAIHTERGVEFLLGDTIYLIRARKGTTALDCRWDLKGLKCTDPVLHIEPDENGELDVVVYDTNDAYELPDITKDFAQCAAESEADYNEFTAHLPQQKSEYGEFFDSLTYSLWIGFMSFKGREVAFSNKFNDQKIYAVEQAVLSLPFSDAVCALNMIGGLFTFATAQGLVPAWVTERQNLYEAVPPLYAYAVSRLIERGSIGDVPDDQLSAFYDAMSKAINWWLNKRTNDKGLVFYAYRHECGWPDDRTLGCGLPAAAPDLAAYFALAADSLSVIADRLRKPDEAVSWNKLYRSQLHILTQTLWDGKRFMCMNSMTGESGSAEGMLSLIPLILGRRLSEEIRNVLAVKAEAVAWEEAAIIPATLIIMGLMDSGREADAKKAAKKFIQSCLSGGANDARGKGVNAGAFYDPAACACLLVLGSRILQ